MRPPPGPAQLRTHRTRIRCVASVLLFGCVSVLPAGQAVAKPKFTPPPKIPGVKNPQEFEAALRRREKEAAAGVPLTPAARWRVQAKNAMSRNWMMLIRERQDLSLTGVVLVKYSVPKSGGCPHVLKVEPKGEVALYLVNSCTKAVAETPLPPVPPELLIPDGSEILEDEVTFRLY